jgi:GTP cyclohydrolase I
MPLFCGNDGGSLVITDIGPTGVKLSPEFSFRAVKRPSRDELETAVRTLIAWTGDDPDRPGLERTPARVADSFAELFAGYAEDPKAQLRRGLLRDDAEGRLVILRGIKFVSTCEHHLLPFAGIAHVGFIARSSLVGIGAIAAAVQSLARRLQIQERLTDELASALFEALRPHCVAVVLEAEHQCLAARGAKVDARLVTSRQLGVAPCEQAGADMLQTLLGSSSRSRTPRQFGGHHRAVCHG